MEQQLSNEEIARVFAMYWGCMAITDGGFGGIIDAIRQEPCEVELVGHGERVSKFKHIQLLLTSLSKITDEHAIELASLVALVNEFSDAFVKTNGYSDLIVYWNNCKEHFNATGEKIYTSEQLQYLISKGYDVPLFFGVEHWANGKTAIELGIAIEK